MYKKSEKQLSLSILMPVERKIVFLIFIIMMPILVINFIEYELHLKYTFLKTVLMN